MSPMPGRSTLMTSAPNQARSCVQVGPAWTWLMSRMRTPSSALPAAPHGLVVGFGRPVVAATLGFLALSLTTFLAGFFAAILVLAFVALLRIGISYLLELSSRPRR